MCAEFIVLSFLCKKRFYNKYLFGRELLVFLFLACFQLYSQKKTAIEILNADVLEMSDSYGKSVKKLIGHVHLKHEEVLFFCDSAYLFDQDNSLRAYGNVRIQQHDSLALYSDSISYNGYTKIADAMGQVRMITPDLQLQTSHLLYDRVKNIAYYLGKGIINGIRDEFLLESQFGQYQPANKNFYFSRQVYVKKGESVIVTDTLQYNEQQDVFYFHGSTAITTPSAKIYCRSGYYNQLKKKSLYQDSVRIYQDHYLLSSDSVVYDEKREIVWMGKNFLFQDTLEAIFLAGNHAVIFHSIDSVVASSDAVLGKITDKDTLFISADTIIFRQRENVEEKDTSYQQLFYAFPYVKIWSEDISGRCDSLVYHSYDSTMQMLGKPVLWLNDLEIYADTIQIVTYDSIIERMHFFYDVYLSEYIDSVRINQMYGYKGLLQFGNNEPAKLTLWPDAASVYYVRDEKNKYVGINRSKSNKIEILFDQGEVSKVSMIEQPEVEMFPPDEKEETFVIEGIQWHFSEKITRTDIPVWRK